MKATELRIGNLVFADLYGEKEILVESICSINNDVFNSTTGEIPFSSLKPIPLTEEWLLKFGFELKIGNYHLENFRFNISNPMNYDGFLFCDGYSVLTEKIKHVHQLQNLYFALTGEELTLKQ